MIVFRLSHVRLSPEQADSESFHLGIFSSRRKAEDAILLLRTKPGFMDFPNDFVIDESLVDQIHWEDGFVSD